MSVDDKYILDILKAENRWMDFDELHSKAQCECDWTDFALQLERLVEQGYVQYTLQPGMDVGRYKIKSQNRKGIIDL